VVLTRPTRSKAFTEEDEQKLSDLSGHLAYALRGRMDKTSEDEEAESESGMVLVEPSGRILYADLVGRRLLSLASWTPWWNIRAKSEIPLWLQQSLKNLRITLRKRIASPPVIYRRTQWGKVAFRVYPLNRGEGVEPPSSSLFGILITRYEPLALQIARGAFVLGLPTRQREICTRLAAGVSYETLAQQLGVRRSTVVDHVRKIYATLDVDDHASLLNKLRCAAANAY
jgi:DNA-binding CsgD family transcriptional regulator